MKKIVILLVALSLVWAGKGPASAEPKITDKEVSYSAAGMPSAFVSGVASCSTWPVRVLISREELRKFLEMVF